MYSIGVDLGGSNIAAGVVNEKGAIVAKGSVPTMASRHYDEIFADMANLCKSLVRKAGITDDEISSIGIGTPGYIDGEKGMIIYANNLNFENVPARESLGKHFTIPIILDNDANCAALGENVAGAAKGCKTSVTITLGTGVGGGIIVDGKVYTGAFSGAGEIGHHVIVVNGVECTCGRKGCLEAYSSAWALIRAAKAAAQADPNGKIMELAQNIDNINAKIVFDAYNLNDPKAVELINNYISYLAEGIVNLINILQPEMIVVGGGISQAGKLLFDPLNKAVSEKVYGSVLKTKIMPALLGNDAGIIGAAMLGK